MHAQGAIFWQKSRIRYFCNKIESRAVHEVSISHF